MTARTVTLALEGWFTKPLHKLPREERICAEAYIKNWSELSPSERRERAVEVDRQRSVKADIRLTRSRRAQERNGVSPAGRAKRIIDWRDATMGANHWFSMADVDWAKAALLLCQFDPDSGTLAADEDWANDKIKPSDLVKLQQRFEDLSRTEPRFRTLSDWLYAAKVMEASYHPWIDEYVDAVAILTPDTPPWQAACAAPATQAAPPAASETATIEPAPAGAADDAAPQRNRNDKCNKPTALTTGQIAAGFDRLRWTTEQWKKPLGDVPKWLKGCRVVSGIRGVSEAQWNPVLIGAALVIKRHASARSVRAKFQSSPPLKPWLEAWKTYEADNFDTA